MGISKKIKMKLFLLAALATADNNFGNKPRPGLCPTNIPDQPNFERDRYVVQWYNYIANDVVNVPENADCVGAKYEKLNERQISINNTAALQIEIRDKILPIASWAYGTGTQLDADYANRLYVHFDEFGGCGFLAFVCGGFEPENELFEDYVDYGEDAFLNYQVAETDYENYSLGRETGDPTISKRSKSCFLFQQIWDLSLTTCSRRNKLTVINMICLERNVE